MEEEAGDVEWDSDGERREAVFCAPVAATAKQQKSLVKRKVAVKLNGRYKRLHPSLFCSLSAPSSELPHLLQAGQSPFTMIVVEKSLGHLKKTGKKERN